MSRSSSRSMGPSARSRPRPVRRSPPARRKTTWSKCSSLRPPLSGPPTWWQRRPSWPWRWATTSMRRSRRLPLGSGPTDSRRGAVSSSTGDAMPGAVGPHSGHPWDLRAAALRQLERDAVASSEGARTMGFGPIEYGVVAFPGNQFKGEIAPALGDLVKSNTIRILDLAFVMKDAEGNVVGVELEDAGSQVMQAFESITFQRDGLISDDDMAEIGTTLDANS